MTVARPKLILASGSPQRRDLLLAAGYEFEVWVPSVRAECGVCSQESPPEYAGRMAWQKALDVLERFPAGQAPEGILVACDTVVECAGRILGKPVDAVHARQMLELLSGRVHHVYSGLCVWLQPGGSPRSQVAATRLRMDTLAAEQLDEYVASGAGKARPALRLPGPRGLAAHRRGERVERHRPAVGTAGGVAPLSPGEASSRGMPLVLTST